jgi:hypothetical protein
MTKRILASLALAAALAGGIAVVEATAVNGDIAADSQWGS